MDKMKNGHKSTKIGKWKKIDKKTKLKIGQ